MLDDNNSLVTKNTFRFLQTLYNMGNAPEPRGEPCGQLESRLRGWRASRTAMVRVTLGKIGPVAGDREAESSRGNPSTAPTWASFAVTVPSRASAWPTMYFVAALTEMSAPRPRGLQSSGVAQVLSTMTLALARMGYCSKAGNVLDFECSRAWRSEEQGLVLVASAHGARRA